MSDIDDLIRLGTIVVAQPADAVRMVDTVPGFAKHVFTGPVPDGQAYVIDVAKIMELPTTGFLFTETD